MHDVRHARFVQLLGAAVLETRPLALFHDHRWRALVRLDVAAQQHAPHRVARRRAEARRIEKGVYGLQAGGVVALPVADCPDNPRGR